METRHQQDTDTNGVTGHAIRHSQGMTVTIEIPAETLQDRYVGFSAAMALVIAMSEPRQGELRLIPGGKR